MTYLELLQRALAEEIEATRLYLACMALAPREDLGVRDADYAAMVPGVD